MKFCNNSVIQTDSSFHYGPQDIHLWGQFYKQRHPLSMITKHRLCVQTFCSYMYQISFSFLPNSDEVIATKFCMWESCGEITAIQIFHQIWILHKICQWNGPQIANHPYLRPSIYMIRLHFTEYFIICEIYTAFQHNLFCKSLFYLWSTEKQILIPHKYIVQDLSVWFTGKHNWSQSKT